MRPPRRWWRSRDAACSARARACSPGLLVAATGVLAFDEILILQSALDPFLAALALERLSAALVRPAAARFVAAGAAFGLLGLNRPNALAACAIVALAALVADRTRRGAGHAVALAAGVALALSPVAIRNRAVTGEWILVSSHGGLNFLIGNHAEATGGYAAPPGVTPTIAGQSADTRRVAEAAAGRPLTDAEVSDHFYREGWRFIRAHPGAAARAVPAQAGARPSAAWSCRSTTRTRTGRATSPRSCAGSWSARGCWCRSASPGLAVPPRVPRRDARSCGRPSSRRTRSRSRCSSSPGATGCRCWSRSPCPRAPRSTGRWRAGAARDAAGWRPLAALFAAGVLLALWPHRVDDGLADERTERLVHLIVEGRGDEARALLARTLPIHADPGLVHYRAGRAWLDVGRPEEAAAELQASLRTSPDQGEVHLALGQALLQARRAAEALPHLERARAAGTFADVAGLETARALLALGRRDEARAVGGGDAAARRTRTRSRRRRSACWR